MDATIYGKNAVVYRSGSATIYARMTDIQYTRTTTCIHRLLQEAYFLPQGKPTYHTKNRVLIAQAHTDSGFGHSECLRMDKY
jgi:hypothetical protein